MRVWGVVLSTSSLNVTKGFYYPANFARNYFIKQWPETSRFGRGFTEKDKIEVHDAARPTQEELKQYWCK